MTRWCLGVLLSNYLLLWLVAPVSVFSVRVQKRGRGMDGMALGPEHLVMGVDDAGMPVVDNEEVVVDGGDGAEVHDGAAEEGVVGGIPVHDGDTALAAVAVEVHEGDAAIDEAPVTESEAMVVPRLGKRFRV